MREQLIRPGPGLETLARKVIIESSGGRDAQAPHDHKGRTVSEAVRLVRAFAKQLPRSVLILRRETSSATSWAETSAPCALHRGVAL
jgi:hypothetical protein